jgi:putative transcription factor
MCGRSGELTDAVVEGAILKVCSECSKLGKVVVISGPVEEERNLENSNKFREMSEEEVEIIVDDYSNIIKNARERKGLKQEELARDIGERESVIHQIESGGMKPDFKLAKKLNAYLRIDLIRKAEKIDWKKEEKKIDFKDKSLTIGDLLRKGGE